MEGDIIPPHKILFGGFSQGGALALEVGMTYRYHCNKSENGNQNCPIRASLPEDVSLGCNSSSIAVIMVTAVTGIAAVTTESGAGIAPISGWWPSTRKC